MHHLGRPFPTAASGGGIVIVVVGTRHPRKGILKRGKKGKREGKRLRESERGQ